MCITLHFVGLNFRSHFLDQYCSLFKSSCKGRFNVDIMMLYISVRDHARKLKFSSDVHLPSINKMFQYPYA